jgi:UDP-2,4-diacetamido-2,4,6-trideoxy-beta-L-altropyranose hydrolase
MRVFFRVDASTEIGTGHVMRCLTLADALLKRGAHCSFLCREHLGNLVDLIRGRGHEVYALPLSAQAVAGPEQGTSGYAAWLGADWATDVQQTLAAINGRIADWLVVDHYAVDARWEKQIRTFCRNLLVIDDLADRPHDCDLLLDQNWLGSEPDLRYERLIPSHGRKLLGPQHALLSPEYAQLRALASERDGIIRRVLVFMGGADPSNQTSKVLEALAHPALSSLVVDVVIGVSHPDPAKVQKSVAGRPGTILYQGVPSLAALMVHADLMIGAGGTTTWERMCLGLPAIVIGIAQNQKDICAALMAAEYIRFLGEMGSVTASDILMAVQACQNDRTTMQNQSRLCRNLVTGNGASELAHIMVTEVQPYGVANAN